MNPHDPKAPISPELEELLGRARPRLSQLCSDYCLAPEEASRVIYRNALELVRRWHRLSGDREEWLVRQVDEACRRLTARQAGNQEGS